MVTKWQSTDLWWKAGLETELQPGKIILKGSGKSPLLLVYLFTGLCWLTSREPGAVNLDENVSSLCGIVSMALCSNILGTCLDNIVHPCENCWNQPRCICCGCNTCVHPNSDRKVKTQGIICKEKKFMVKTLYWFELSRLLLRFPCSREFCILEIHVLLDFPSLRNSWKCTVIALWQTLWAGQSQ